MVAHKMDKKNLVRQPVESLFNWINQKTELQNASKVRAVNALMVHILEHWQLPFFITYFNPIFARGIIRKGK